MVLRPLDSTTNYTSPLDGLSFLFSRPFDQHLGCGKEYL